MSRLARLLAASAVIATAFGLAPTSGAVAAPSAPGAPVDRAGRTAVVIEPGVYDDLVEAGVAVTPLGRATVTPFEDTLRVVLPVSRASGSAVHHRGGIRFETADADLEVRGITIPSSGFVSGAVEGSEVGDLGRVLLFLQADSSSPFGDTSLRFTWTFASYLNESFDTDFAELRYFGYATTRLR